ncbi:hypothetical protein FM106_23370 [Brachybacterium faecium]|nr:hypothetical protein FM106_23370 [Brachybacterium faecium]
MSRGHARTLSRTVRAPPGPAAGHEPVIACPKGTVARPSSSEESAS